MQVKPVLAMKLSLGAATEIITIAMIFLAALGLERLSIPQVVTLRSVQLTVLDLPGSYECEGGRYVKELTGYFANGVAYNCSTTRVNITKAVSEFQAMVGELSKFGNVSELYSKPGWTNTDFGSFNQIVRDFPGAWRVEVNDFYVTQEANIYLTFTGLGLTGGVQPIPTAQTFPRGNSIQVELFNLQNYLENMGEDLKIRPCSCTSDTLLNADYLASVQATFDRSVVVLSYVYLAVVAAGFLMRLVTSSKGEILVLGNFILNIKSQNGVSESNDITTSKF